MGLLRFMFLVFIQTQILHFIPCLHLALTKHTRATDLQNHRSPSEDRYRLCSWRQGVERVRHRSSTLSKVFVNGSRQPVTRVLSSSVSFARSYERVLIIQTHAQVHTKLTNRTRRQGRQAAMV